MIFDKTIVQLNDFVKKFDIENVAIKACDNYLDSLFIDKELQNELIGIAKQNIKIKLKKHTFVFHNIHIDYPYIESFIELTFNDIGNDEVDFGEYRYIFSVDGKFIDEYFEFA